MSNSGIILLVEDDEDDQQMMTELLEGLKIENQLVIKKNGEEALDFLLTTHENPFLILCDVNMPVMDGLELRQRISDNEFLRRKSIPFIFLTTTANPAAVIKAYEMCVQGFFEKSSGLGDFRNLLLLIVNYWRQCKHPNSMQPFRQNI